MAQILGEEDGAARRTFVRGQKLRPFPWFERHMVGVHGEVGLVTAGDEVGRPVLLGDIRQLKHNTHHARMNPSVGASVAEDGIDLLRPSAVQVTGPFTFLPPDTEGAFETNIGTDDLVKYLSYLGMVDEETRRTARYVSLCGRK